MRRLGILFWSLITLVVFVTPQLLAQEIHPGTSSLHCLWKARGASNSVYFLGSIHDLREADYPLPQVIESAFTNCPIAVFEWDMSKPLDSNTVAVLRAKTWLPAGTTLKELLPASLYLSFSNHAEEAGLSMAKSFDSMKPAFAAEKLQILWFERMGAYFDQGLDMHFAQLARKSGKLVIGLEPPGFQIDFFVNLSSSEQELMVERCLSHVDNEEKEFNDMLSAWKNGDAVGLDQLMNDQRTNAPTIYKKLVTDRNATWMPEVKRLLQGSLNAIVIVGAAHLVGSDGIIESLKKQGVVVTQL